MTMIATMIAALAASPVAAEMPAANSSTRISGSRNRRAIALGRLVLRAATSVFGP